MVPWFSFSPFLLKDWDGKNTLLTVCFFSIYPVYPSRHLELALRFFYPLRTFIRAIVKPQN
jgi:hypothetical protein